MRTALRVHVVTQVDDIVAVMAQHVAVFLDDVAELERLGNHHRGLAGERAAGVQADDGLVLRERRLHRLGERLAVVGLHRVAVGQVHGDTGGLLERVRQMDLAQVCLGLLADEDGDHGLAALLEQVDHLVAHGGRGRL